MRGGSWNNTDDNARAAIRNRNNPNNRNDNSGFRVCLSTFFMRSPELCRVHGFDTEAEEWRGPFLAAPRASWRGRANTNRPAPWVNGPWGGAPSPK